MIVLETEKLRLRQFVEYDADFIVQLLNEPSFLRNIGDRKVRTTEDAIQYIVKGPIESYKKNGFGLLCVELKDSRAPVGMCGLIKRDALEDVDIGFAFLEFHMGKGYASESAVAVMEYGRHVCQLKRIVGITLTENKGSVRVLQKLGMKFEGMVKITPDEPELQLYAISYS